MLASNTFDGQIPKLPPVAIVVQEAGYNQLRARKIAQLDSGLGEIAKVVRSKLRKASQSTVGAEALIN